MSELTHPENGKVRFELHISGEDYVRALESAYRRLAARYQIPGFRKGKAPRKVIEKSYGENVFWDNEFDALVQHAYSDALAEHNIIPELQPEIHFTAISEQDGVDFTAEVVTRPTVELGQYKGIEVERVEYTVTDEDVKKEINNRLEAQARTVSVDRPVQEGDSTVIDFAGFLGDEQFEGGTAENYTLKIGSHTFIPGFEEQMVGMNKGEQRDIKVTFPTDYQAEHLAGKEVIFKVTVHEINFEEIPELDDDFVQDTSEFNTVAEFEANIREELEKRAKENSKFAYENAAVQKAVDNAKVEIHKDIVEEEVDMQIKRFEQQLSMYGTSLKDYIDYAGITMEDIRNDYRKGAEANLKAQYVIGAIVDEEKIEPTEANYIEAVRRSNPGPDWDDEKVKAELEKNRSRYVSSAIFEAVVELIVSNSVAVEPKHDEHDEHCDCGCEHDENK
ncbi:MAG: trigger factor [Eubacteriales bacterium]|nr:trigger factor [Clostridiales bacterium]MDY3308195.1 trigger factor [Eubacteriales bacterium]MDY4621378.1 trigger factor [Eubacteriales bacterium]